MRKKAQERDNKPNYERWSHEATENVSHTSVPIPPAQSTMRGPIIKFILNQVALTQYSGGEIHSTFRAKCKKLKGISIFKITLPLSKKK